MESSKGSFWLPPQASTGAAEVDELFGFIMDLNYIFFAIILAMTVYFVVKYRRTREDQLATTDFDHSSLWEGAWAFIPLALCFVMFAWGFQLFISLQVAPEGSIQINAAAQKWAWSFTYDDGQTTSDLYVPAGEPVKITLKSKDVLHSFYIPDFRIKSDVIPNRYTTVWFEAIEPGTHRIYCTEFCGKDHSAMYRTVHVLSQEDYAKKKSEGFEGKPEGLDPVTWGGQLYKKLGCNACHSTDGSRLVGPSFKGLWGREGKTAAGESYKADAQYINESIMEPQAKIVEGYPPVMPSFKGQVSDDQMNALIAYIKTLK